MGGGNVIEVGSKSAWDKILAEAGGKVVLVDFTATWCGPCRMIGPYFEELSTKPEYQNIIFLKVDVDANEEVAHECKVSAMPTFKAFANGTMVDELVGAAKDKLKAMADKYKEGVVGAGAGSQKMAMA